MRKGTMLGGVGLGLMAVGTLLAEVWPLVMGLAVVVGAALMLIGAALADRESRGE